MTNDLKIRRVDQGAPSDPLVSIVIPAFNAERWIRASIASALAQTYTRKEVIVVDDGSTDKTSNIIQEFGADITSVWQRNCGPSAARNKGVEIASGSLVQFLDSDDILHCERLEILVGVMKRYPSAEFASSGYATFADDDVPIGFRRAAPACEIHMADALNVDYLPCTGLFRRTFLEYVGLFDSELRRWVDLELHSRMAATVGVAPHLAFPLYGYRQHSGERISRHNHAHTGLDSALESLRKTTDNLLSSSRSAQQVGQYLFPFYILLARGYASSGDSQRFRALVGRAAGMTTRRAFKVKAAAIKIVERIAGTQNASRLLERVLRR